MYLATRPGPLLESFNCGKSSLVATDVGDLTGQWTRVNDGELPWQVYITDAQGDRPICGGTLISPRHVLTTGQCTTFKFNNNADAIKVVVGGKATVGPMDQRLSVAKIYQHPGFRTQHKGYRWDLSILVLSTCVKITRTVQP